MGTSIDNIKSETEMYGNKVADSEIIHSHLNLVYSDSEQRHNILGVYYMDGKTHESFDELSEQDALKFIETVQKNLNLLNAQKKE